MSVLCASRFQLPDVSASDDAPGTLSIGFSLASTIAGYLAIQGAGSAAMDYVGAPLVAGITRGVLEEMIEPKRGRLEEIVREQLMQNIKNFLFNAEELPELEKNSDIRSRVKDASTTVRRINAGASLLGRFFKDDDKRSEHVSSTKESIQNRSKKIGKSIGKVFAISSSSFFKAAKQTYDLTKKVIDVAQSAAAQRLHIGKKREKRLSRLSRI